ncbi:MAG: glycosyltransferase family protein [Rhodothermales bacterium]
MARIIYALSGQGRGHTSRVIAISDELQRRGHEVLFCCGGTAQDILESQGERVLHVPALRHAMQGNELRFWSTLRKNWKNLRSLRRVVEQLAETFAARYPDLLITDFEFFSARAARRMKLPILSFNHQQIVTETRYRLPWRHRLDALLACSTIKTIAPKRPEHLLLSSFFFPPLKHPEQTTMVPPIIRPAVQVLQPRKENHVLVYYNETAGSNYVLDTLRQVDASFIVYNFDLPEHPEAYPNLQFKKPSLDGFLDDLARSRAVLCTAGFTLISEALYLGKPLLVVPNHGIFEQTLNALFLQREHLGNAVIDRPMSVDDVASFLSQLDRYEKRLRNRPVCGNKKAVVCIEGVLSQITPSVHPRPHLPYPAIATAS